jgi:hypothetical protein
MPAYSFYFLDSHGRVLGPPTVVEFENDRGAIEAAEAILDQKTVEVWDKERVVIRLEPKQI